MAQQAPALGGNANRFTFFCKQNPYGDAGVPRHARVQGIPGAALTMRSAQQGGPSPPPYSSCPSAGTPERTITMDPAPADLEKASSEGRAP